MDPRERVDTTWPTTHRDHATDSGQDHATSAERLLAGFTYAERQRLRYLRQLYERGKLTEFPRQPRG
jgi:hypothetical protein